MNPALASTPAWPAWRIVQWGLLWALFVSAAEFFVISPLHTMSLINFLIWWLGTWLLPLWCVLGFGLLLIARRFEPRNHWIALGTAAAALSLACSLLLAGHAHAMEHWMVQVDWLRVVLAATGFEPMLPSQFITRVAYNLWVALFYGGLLVAAYVLMVRSERLRSLLREAALARSRTEALLGEARLQGLQAQVDPQLLLSTLDEVQALYRREPERADALLERLVEFLRAAVPGLKQRRSTLQAELQLAQAYAELQALLPAGRRWTVEAPKPLPELPFPSLLLLPILTLPGPQATPRLAVRVNAGKALLQVQGLGCELPPRLVQHTRACLRDLLGDSARLRADGSCATALEIELDLP